ncbi:uncharacterized protein E0L32_005288 [Thyridium curvatum]|uniref:Ubiquitin carboxyl-terminal hydrolase n=1 Tax=Thyridium curvatum TaxID=1093900 RepID=A0A507B672_9PEZI|nr:uncharacterized protein E0L32_005288 [Thyridium curvatum]TPX14596.1 hypothetical protein E0L32_005288 [Thyridium curvatum]
MPAPGVHILPSGRKSFIPLENNPAVFTSLIHDLGASKALSFHDIYSLDDADLLALVPRPVPALIFITPAGPYDAVRAADGTRVVGDGGEGLTYDPGAGEPVTWYLQTIDNACGLMALLHCLSNGAPRRHVIPGSAVGRFIERAAPLGPLDRARLLNDDEEIEAAHMRAARGGDSAVPPSEVHAPLHFIAFVQGDDGHLWELEGGSDGPIDRGVMAEGEDMLSEGVLDRGIRRFLRAEGEDVQFSIVGLSLEEDAV